MEFKGRNVKSQTAVERHFLQI